jgi:hypothetical protein
MLPLIPCSEPAAEPAADSELDEERPPLLRRQLHTVMRSICETSATSFVFNSAVMDIARRQFMPSGAFASPSDAVKKIISAFSAYCAESSSRSKDSLMSRISQPEFNNGIGMVFDKEVLYRRVCDRLDHMMEHHDLDRTIEFLNHIFERALNAAALSCAADAFLRLCTINIQHPDIIVISIEQIGRLARLFVAAFRDLRHQQGLSRTLRFFKFQLFADRVASAAVSSIFADNWVDMMQFRPHDDAPHVGSVLLFLLQLNKRTEMERIVVEATPRISEGQKTVCWSILLNAAVRSADS